LAQPLQDWTRIALGDGLLHHREQLPLFNGEAVVERNNSLVGDVRIVHDGVLLEDG
jgi:hypothetical protein